MSFLKNVVPLEKKIFIASLCFSLALLALIAFASFKFGITLPGCVKDMKPFSEGSLEKKSDHNYELHVVAKMWAFDPASVNIPVGSTVDIFVSSIDVNHGFHIAGTNVNLMAVPGVVNYAQMKFVKAGDYPIVCHEYCGVGHQTMYAIVHVTEEAGTSTLQTKVVPVVTETAPAEVTTVEKGKRLYSTKACSACHSADGSKLVGPTFKGLYGSKVMMVDGSEVEANDAHITNCIKNPQSVKLKGYENVVMPPLPVTDEEIKDLIEYIKTLR